jgi:hypothetical protein
MTTPEKNNLQQEICRRILVRDTELKEEKTQSETLEATLEALKQITQVPPSEMAKIAQEVKSEININQEKEQEEAYWLKFFIFTILTILGLYLIFKLFAQFLL